ncbi:hypothetical protein BpHYR1_016203 [Brachionus plicatilis]|uniref:Uncharacterized protein n=1 Tax=Brachionus plicatilis TaxID=10195 RepID=A0A3M7R3J5_BRAPC|nr:hypothetical protein BpHYR1_016203 [Brachionus plicatilis]
MNELHLFFISSFNNSTQNGNQKITLVQQSLTKNRTKSSRILLGNPIVTLKSNSNINADLASRFLFHVYLYVLII